MKTEILSKNSVNALNVDGTVEFTGTAEYVTDGWVGIRDPKGGVWEYPVARVQEVAQD